MRRDFTYTKERLRYILEQILENDVMARDEYLEPARAVEGFEKRAVLEFAMWFFGESIPDNFAFGCTYDELESDYPQDVARILSHAPSWTKEPEVRDVDSGDSGNVVEAEFGRRDDEDPERD
jgi:hypothetical protein